MKTKFALVLGAAITAMSGAAFAAQWEAIPDATDVPPVTSAVEQESVADRNVLVSAEGVEFQEFLVNGTLGESQKLWVSATHADSHLTGLYSNDAEKPASNNGTIFVTASGEADPWSQKGMMAQLGGKVVNNGTIVVKNAYGMTAGTAKDGNKAANTIENNGVIQVLDKGVGIELGGAANSTATNKGTILVGANNGEKDSFTHGVLIKDQTGAIFTNYGTIDTSADNATSIDIQESTNGTTYGTILNLQAGSRVLGEVRIATGVEDTTLNANGYQGSIDLNNQSDAFTLKVAEGANVTLEDGNKSKIQNLVVEDGMISASIWQSDNQFKKITVEHDGIFNVTKLNSGGDKDDLATKPHDTLLIAYGTNMELDGGALYVAGSEYQGKVKVGSYNEAQNGTLNVTGGEYSFSDMTVGSGSSLKISNDASVEFDSLLVYRGNAEKGTNGGEVNITGGSLTVDDITFEDTTGKLTLSGGTLNTITDSLFTGEALKGNFDLQSGTIGIDGTFDQSLAAAIDDGITLVADEVVAKVDGQEVKITTIKNEDLSTNVEGVNARNDIVYSGATLQATEVPADYDAIRINPDLKGVQKVEILSDKTTHLDLDSNFTIVGDGSQLVVGSNEQSQFRIGGNTLTLGATADQVKGGTYLGTITAEGHNGTVQVVGGDFNLNVVDVATFNVDEVASVNMTNLKTKTAQIDGSLTVKTLEATDATVDGYVMTDTLATGSNVTVGGFFGVQTIAEGATVKTEDAGSDPKNIPSGDFYIAEAATDADGNRVAQIQGTLTALGDSYLMTNLSAAAEQRLDAALASLGDKFDEDTDAVAYVDHTIDVGENGILNLGNVSAAGQAGANAVKLATNSIVVVDAGKFISSGDAVFGAEVTLGSDGQGNNAQVVLDNLLSKGTIKFGEKLNSAGTNYYSDTNLFLNVSEVSKDDGTLTIGFNRDAVQGNDDLANALDQVLAQGGNREDQGVINAIGQYDPFLNQDGTALNAKGQQATEEYLAMPATAGTYNVAYDATEQVTAAIQRRNLEPSTGLGVWADVFYASNEAKTMYGDSGYSADIYGGTIGFDGTFSCGAMLGLALSIGNGDADSEKSVGKYGNDADFWGVSIYTGKDIAGLYFSADASYLSFDNDITGSIAGASVKESIDSSVFTIGVRADMTVWDEGFKVVPHVGLRYTKIDVDDYRGLDSDSMDVFETPIGVKIAGDFEPSAGWTLTPSFDFTIVPQLGDKDVNTLIGDVDVLDNVYNSTLGVNASYGNFTFGLSYRYGFGTNDRSNNAFQARAAYAF